jgi:RND family efflux transporter MFP subunit
VLPVLVLAVLFGCNNHADPVPQSEVRPVRTVIARSEEWSALPSQVGEIRSHAETDLGFKISGKLIERTVDLGAIVRKGDVIARLDEQDQRNQLSAAQAEHASAQATLVHADAEERRQAQLRASGWATQAKYDSSLQARDAARAAVRAADAKRKLAEAQLGYAVLRAPEDGAISAISAEPGQVVAAGQMIVRLADLDDKDAVFTIAESVVLRLRQDMEVEVRLLDLPQVAARGKVRHVSPKADPITRTYLVKVGLTAPPDAMRLGMSVVGRVREASRKVIALPSSALAEKDGRPAVWVVDPEQKTVELTPVELANAEIDRVMVSSGLFEGTIVVTAGVQRLWPGLKVRLMDGVDHARRAP